MGAGQLREFYLMWILGQDLPSIVSVRPADGEDWPPIADKSLIKEEIAIRHNIFSLSWSISWSLTRLTG